MLKASSAWASHWGSFWKIKHIHHRLPGQITRQRVRAGSPPYLGHITADLGLGQAGVDLSVIKAFICSDTRTIPSEGGPIPGNCPIVPFADRVNAASQGSWHRWRNEQGKQGWSWMEKKSRNSQVLEQQKRAETEERNRQMDCGTEHINTH